MANIRIIIKKCMETDNKVNTISIAMCTYNGSKYLAEQLDSIFRQTRQPDEIVICDDCSQDDTVELAKMLLNNWGGKYSLIQNEKNLGFVKNFEKAIGLCHGDIIFLSDQDDVWDIRKIDTMIQAFEKHPEAAMVFHDSELVDKNLKTLFPSFWKNTLNFDDSLFFDHNYVPLYKNNVVQGSASAIKKSVYRKAIPFYYKACHDEWLTLVALTIGEIIPIPNILMKYRQENNEIGGIPASFNEKIKRIFTRTNEKYLEDSSEHLRRLSLLKNFATQYRITKSNYKLNIIAYIKFLKQRIQNLQLKKIQLGFFQQYKKFYLLSKKEILRDSIEIIFRK